MKKAHVSRFVYSCKSARNSAHIRSDFAGIAKDPPQSVSLFIPTNVGIHGGVKWARTIDLYDVNDKLDKMLDGRLYKLHKSSYLYSDMVSYIL